MSLPSEIQNNLENQHELRQELDGLNGNEEHLALKTLEKNENPDNQN